MSRDRYVQWLEDINEAVGDDDAVLAVLERVYEAGVDSGMDEGFYRASSGEDNDPDVVDDEAREDWQ